MAAFPGASLRRVADEIKTDYTHLFRLEAGQYVPSDETLAKLAAAYKLTPNERLELFGLAHHSPSFAQVMKEADMEAITAFYRKEKK